MDAADWSYLRGVALYQAGDYRSAVKHFRDAAETGHAGAQYFLGRSFSKGNGVSQNYAAAARWYRKAAEQGDPASQAALGSACARGEGVAVDRVEGYTWLNVAVALDSDPETRDSKQRARDRLAEILSADQLAEGQRRSAEWIAAFNARAR